MTNGKAKLRELLNTCTENLDFLGKLERVEQAKSGTSEKLIVFHERVEGETLELLLVVSRDESYSRLKLSYTYGQERVVFAITLAQSLPLLVREWISSFRNSIVVYNQYPHGGSDGRDTENEA